MQPSCVEPLSLLDGRVREVSAFDSPPRAAIVNSVFYVYIRVGRCHRIYKRVELLRTRPSVFVLRAGGTQYAQFSAVARSLASHVYAREISLIHSAARNDSGLCIINKKWAKDDLSRPLWKKERKRRRTFYGIERETREHFNVCRRDGMGL